MRTSSRQTNAGGLRVKLPALKPASPEEIERRRQVVEKIFRLRDEIGPIDLTVEELLVDEDDREDDG